MERLILFFGRNPAMMSLVGNQLKGAGYNAEGFVDEEELMTELNKGHVRLLVLGGGVEDAPRRRLKEFCEDKGILVLEHFAGAGTLPGSIGQVMSGIRE